MPFLELIIALKCHDAKGIVYSRRDGDDKLHLNWSKVTKRVDYLISTDRYITTEEKIRLEEIQRDKAGIIDTPPIPEITEPVEETADSTPISVSKQEEIEQKETSQEMAQDTTEETIPIPYSKGDIIYLENGTPFLIEEITDYRVTLRDPSCFIQYLGRKAGKVFYSFWSVILKQSIRGKS